jgi:hypothetical protein
MRKTASILLSIYIILQSAYFIAGAEESVCWNCLYFFNQNFIICSVLWMLRGFFNDILISIAISLNIVEMLYNTVYLINIDIAEKINDSHYIAVFIVMTIVFVLILKLSENDSTGKKIMA